MLKSLALGVMLSLLWLGVAGAAPPEPGKAPVSPARPPVGLALNPCPAGWHLVPGWSGGAFLCEVNKPKPVQCPPKHQWVEQFKDGKCLVGCLPIIY